MEDQLKLDIALQSISRKWGQSGTVLQQGFGDFTAQSLPEGTILRQTVSKEASEGALKTGFKAVDGEAGKGVYFSTEQTPGPAGSVEIYGELNEDLLILDLVSSFRKLEDLAKEVFALDIKIGKPNSINGIDDIINNPRYATTIGLIKYVHENNIPSNSELNEELDLVDIAKGVIRKILKYFKLK